MKAFLNDVNEYDVGVIVSPLKIPGSDEQRALELVRSWKDAGLRVGLCHGVFDVLHPGHLRHFTEAKHMVDKLVVSTTGDKFLLERTDAVAFSEVDRWEQLSALRDIDLAIISQSATGVEVIRKLGPHLYFKGPDYDHGMDAVGNLQEELHELEQIGGEFRVTKGLRKTSTGIRRKIQGWNFEPLREGLRTASLFGKQSSLDLPSLRASLEACKNLRALVVGEAIVDEYVSCETLGRSAKYPLVAVEEKTRSRHAGGTLAIARHMEGLGCRTHVLADVELQQLNDATGGEIQNVVRAPGQGLYPAVEKVRYIDAFSGTVIHEVYRFPGRKPDEEWERSFASLIHELTEKQNLDLMLVADYGNGFLHANEVSLLNRVAAKTTWFSAVNAQGNAGNNFQNSITKFKGFDFVQLNGIEVDFEIREENISPIEIAERLRLTTESAFALITLGWRGFAMSSQASSPFYFPVPTMNAVQDRTGAGDAVLAVCAALLASGAPILHAAFLGAVAGSLAVRFQGNEVAIDSSKLLRESSTWLAAIS